MQVTLPLSCIHFPEGQATTTGKLPSSPCCSIGGDGWVYHTLGSYEALHPHEPRPAWSRELVLSVQTVPASCRLLLL